MNRSVFASGLLLWFFPVVAFGHGFGARVDLPIPLPLYLLGGGAVVALSFILLGFVSTKHIEKLVAYPTINLSDQQWFRVLQSRPVIWTLQGVSLLFFLLAVGAGLWGTANPAFNLLPVSFWILFAIGFTFFSAAIGNIWNVINPVATLFVLIEPIVRKVRFLSKPRIWPVGYGVWFALVLFFIFRWIENVSTTGGNPQLLAQLLIVYSVIMIVGMSIWGRNTWLSKGDPFTVFFSLLALFSVTEVRGETGKVETHLRPPALGLTKEAFDITEVFFVLLMLSTVAADGIFATPFANNLFATLLSIGLPWIIVGTLGLLLLFALFVLVYFIFSYGMKIVARDTLSTTAVAKRFIYSLIPIAIAYEVAHFSSVLLVDGQRIMYLISDPLNRGWDLFGTATYEVNYAILNLKLLWNTQVFLIVLGHVIAVVVAHVLALRAYSNMKQALLSQYPMLLLMIFYSMLSLWIIAQPIVAL